MRLLKWTAVVGLATSVVVGQTSSGLLGALPYFAPIAEYDSTVNVGNNQTETARTIQIECSNSMPEGQLYVGDYLVNVTCIPPTYNYYYDEVGTIPRFVTLMVDKSCAVGDVDQFNANNANTTLAALQQVSQQYSQNYAPVATSSRRLLQDALSIYAAVVGTVALGVAIDALATANTALSTANYAVDKVNALGNVVASQQNSINNLTEGLSVVQSGLQDTSVALGNLSAAFDQQVNVNNQLNLAINNTVDLVNNLANSTQQSLLALQNSTSNAISALANHQLQIDNVTNAQLTNLYTLVTGLANTTAADSLTFYGNFQQAQEEIAGVNSIVWDLINQRQLRNQASASFFIHSQLLPAGVMPLTLDAGAPPVNVATNTLNQPYWNVIMEQTDLNWVGYSVNPGINGIPTGTVQATANNRQYKFYWNTTYAVNMAKPFMTMESIFNVLGPNGCVRPNTADVFIPGVSYWCRAWIDVYQDSCITKNNNFTWATALPNTTALNQPGLITGSTDPYNFCLTGSASSVNTGFVGTYTNVSAWFADVNNVVCAGSSKTLTNSGTTYGNKALYVHAYNSQQVAYMPVTTAAACQTNYQTQQTAAPASPAKLLMTYWYLAFPGFVSSLYTYNMMMYGRLPGGLTFETVPFEYAPTQTVVDPSTGAVTTLYNAGAEPLSCTYVYWLAASDLTVPIYSVTPLAGDELVKQINVAISPLASAATANAGSQVIAVPPQLDVYDGNNGNIILDNDLSNELPNNILTVGHVDDVLLYDVPEVLLDVSGNIVARRNKVSYYLMAPGTQNTLNLSSWVATNLGGGADSNLYNPTDASVSASAYAFPTIYDADDYPVRTCNLCIILFLLHTGSNTMSAAYDCRIKGDRFEKLTALLLQKYNLVAELKQIGSTHDQCDIKYRLPGDTVWRGLQVKSNHTVVAQMVERRNYPPDLLVVFYANTRDAVWIFQVHQILSLITLPKMHKYTVYKHTEIDSIILALKKYLPLSTQYQVKLSPNHMKEITMVQAVANICTHLRWQLNVNTTTTAVDAMINGKRVQMKFSNHWDKQFPHIFHITMHKKLFGKLLPYNESDFDLLIVMLGDCTTHMYAIPMQWLIIHGIVSTDTQTGSKALCLQSTQTGSMTNRFHACIVPQTVIKTIPPKYTECLICYRAVLTTRMKEHQLTNTCKKWRSLTCRIVSYT